MSIFTASKTVFILGYTPYVYSRCDNDEDILNGKWEVFVRYYENLCKIVGADGHMCSTELLF